MNQGFKRLFWGYLLILLEIHYLVVDILPDPLGYYLICSGVVKLSREFPLSTKAKNLAILMIFISIPTVFIQQNAPELNQNWLWSSYATAIDILNLILVFYLFQVIMKVATKLGDLALISRSAITFKVYIIVMLIITFSQSFLMNTTSDWMYGYAIITIPISLIMEILFLLLLRKVGKEVKNRGESTIKLY
ncbi:hypothetical protein [Fredinandcohnia quinoae]|uniref:DUF2975 domain-containing protein n=1 Tax=Fredinandcohnia quinoae TaxID=2918902 RepID=A0AAW5E9Y9_9BACI|nr:hypothetical protein [Fredinandcohnia sp. SECRCQ15]MCH1626707.1 hypothetical protein [Fredinandcohnia sp. SECRCQ15]